MNNDNESNIDTEDEENDDDSNDVGATTAIASANITTAIASANTTTAIASANTTTDTAITIDNESDSDDCIIISTPASPVIIIDDESDVSVDSDHNDNNNDDDDDDNDDLSWAVPSDNNILDEDQNMHSSSDDSNTDHNDQIGYFSDDDENEEITVPLYCSICKDTKYEHDCTEYNKELSTCMIPNCNVVFRSTKDFDQHYIKHLGVAPGAVICRLCYTENKESYTNLPHIQNCNQNVFVCYMCRVLFENMAQIAHHKLKYHKGRLVVNGTISCLHCEFQSDDMLFVSRHEKDCRKKQIENAVNQTETTNENSRRPYKYIITKNMKFFICKQCDEIFGSLINFKKHILGHLVGRKKMFMCWKCLKPQDSRSALLSHQRSDDCNLGPEFLKCNTCGEHFHNIETFSVHRYTKHDALYLYEYPTIPCPFCKIEFAMKDLKDHLNICSTEKETFRLNNTGDSNNFICTVCNKIFNRKIGYIAHIKTHAIIGTKYKRM